MTKTITAAVVDAIGRVRSLVAKREPGEDITEAKVAESKWLARLLTRIVRSLAELERRPCPRRIDFEDVEVNGDGVTVYRFQHRFSGRVRWWVTDCLLTDGALHRESTTDEDTLALLSEQPGVVTLRIEEVG